MPDVTVIEQVVVGPIAVVQQVVVGPVRVIQQAVFTGPPGGGASIDTVAPGVAFYITRVDGEWPDRPTTREDLMVFWVGPDPSPDIVEPPSVAGMYAGDARLVPE